MNRPKKRKKVQEALPKLNQLSFGLFALVVAVGFGLILLLASLSPEGRITPTSAAVSAAIIIAVVELLLGWIGQAATMPTEGFEPKEVTVWSMLALFYRYADFAKIAILSSVFVVIFVAVGYGLVRAVLAEPAISAGSITYVLLYGVYMSARPLFRSNIRRMGRQARWWTVHCRVEEEGVTIDFNVGGKGKPVFLRFNELDEVRTFTFVEAQAYLNYTVGPDVGLTVQDAKDLAAYVGGKIVRPSVFIHGAASSGTNVLLRGPDIFYFTVFDKEDAEDLVQKFREYKKGEGKR